MYARTCISRQMPGGTFVMQLHPPDYAGHDIRNALNATTLCYASVRRIPQDCVCHGIQNRQGTKRRLNPAPHGRTHDIQ